MWFVLIVWFGVSLNHKHTFAKQNKDKRNPQ